MLELSATGLLEELDELEELEELSSEVSFRLDETILAVCSGCVCKGLIELYRTDAAEELEELEALGVECCLERLE